MKKRNAEPAAINEYVTAQEQATDCGVVRFKKIFGEYIVYVNDKSILLVCDNSIFVKILPCLDELMADEGLPLRRRERALYPRY